MKGENTPWLKSHIVALMLVLFTRLQFQAADASRIVAGFSSQQGQCPFKAASQLFGGRANAWFYNTIPERACVPTRSTSLSLDENLPADIIISS